MKKKILLSLISVVAVAGGVAALSAFEAHIINVTAHIENALAVDTTPIEFGTVFPQEYLEKPFTISLSDSFMAEDRVDDVEYDIIQKLKPCRMHKESCGPACEQLVPDDPTCVEDTPEATPHKPTGWHYQSLCPYLSKMDGDPEDGNDTGVPSYFDGQLLTCQTPSPDYATGRLAKSEQDTEDSWTVDLKVPPITGTVGQDWPDGCPALPANDITYGCDLWIEVTGISLPNGHLGCLDEADVMLVLDRSGSISGTELATLKTASHAFVDALNPDGGVHMGQTSFSDSGTLDLHLTGNETDIDAAIDALSSGGFTNLYEGINLAKGELDNAHGHERAAVPDFMIIITDGNPNRPPDDANARAVAAAEADAARAAGIEIYVVGVGGDVDATYLTNEIADDASHYFSAADFDDLQAVLEDIGNCI